MFRELILGCLIFHVVFSGQVIKSGVQQCYNNICPDGTYSCKKHSYVSKDKQHFETDISCLDMHKGVLQTYHDTARNPFGPHEHFETYSYSSVYLVERYFPIKPTLTTTPDPELHIIDKPLESNLI